MKRYILLCVLALAFFLRTYQLAHVPPSPSLDEVSIGYNAFSILHTGKDEYGNRFPLLLRAYDDFRPALYVYLAIPFIWFLGLSEIAVRLPSVLLSVGTVYITYATGRLIGKKYLAFERFGEIAALILALSPWHIYLSRLGHEANAGLALVAAGAYWFLRAALSGASWGWVASGIAFGLSAHGYQSEKLISPLLIASGVVLFRKELRKAGKSAVLGGILCFLIALPAIVATLEPSGMVRFRGTSAFSHDAPEVVAARTAYTSSLTRGDSVGRIIHSKYVAYASIFSKQYIWHYAPGWLFGGGDREAHKVPGMGLLYLWELPFLLFGFWAVWKLKIPRSVAWFLVLGVLMAPIPAAITTQAPHAMRSYTMIPFLQVIEAVGVWFIVWRRGVFQLRLLVLGIGVVVVVTFQTFWQGYFVRFPREQSDSFQYAMQSAVNYGTQVSGDYESVQFSHRGSLYQSYMFFLYYSRFDPSTYLALGGTSSGGYEAAHYIGTYAFGFLPQDSEELDFHTLYFYDVKQVPPGVRIEKTFTDLDGKPAIVAITKQ